MSLIDKLKSQFANSKKKQKDILEKEKNDKLEIKNNFESIVGDKQFLKDLNELMVFFDEQNKSNPNAEKCGYKIEEYSDGPRFIFCKDGYAQSEAYIELEGKVTIKVGSSNVNNLVGMKFNIRQKKYAQEYFLKLVTKNMSLVDNDR